MRWITASLHDGGAFKIVPSWTVYFENNMADDNEGAAILEYVSIFEQDGRTSRRGQAAAILDCQSYWHPF